MKLNCVNIKVISNYFCVNFGRLDYLIEITMVTWSEIYSTSLVCDITYGSIFKICDNN